MERTVKRLAGNPPRVSVIVPVYNVKPYLKRCVDSIIVQSFVDFELILVDDGSTDGSGEICDTYARADGRVQVLHKPNGGLSDARNHGLDRARGAYITFIDSDDLIGGLQKTEAIIGKGFSKRNNGQTLIGLHLFCKFTDMIEIPATVAGCF